jgi:hypothetical protein
MTTVKKPIAKKPAPKKPTAKPVPTGLPSGIVFFCKDCHKLVKVHRVGRRFVYTCAECGTKNVAFGTDKSIRSFFHVKDEEEEEVAEAAPDAEKSKVQI